MYIYTYIRICANIFKFCIRSLKDFRNCRFLTELYLRKNDVTDLMEVSTYSPESPIYPQKISTYPQKSPMYTQKSPVYPPKSPKRPQKSPIYPQKSPVYTFLAYDRIISQI